MSYNPSVLDPSHYSLILSLSNSQAIDTCPCDLCSGTASTAGFSSNMVVFSRRADEQTEVATSNYVGERGASTADSDLLTLRCKAYGQEEDAVCDYEGIKRDTKSLTIIEDRKSQCAKSGITITEEEWDGLKIAWDEYFAAYAEEKKESASVASTGSNDFQRYRSLHFIANGKKTQATKTYADLRGKCSSMEQVVLLADAERAIRAHQRHVHGERRLLRVASESELAYRAYLNLGSVQKLEIQAIEE